MTDGTLRPVEMFLGAAAAAGGPFALLALAPEDCTQELIIVQLQRQLKKVAAHPEASSHAADEVRLALHAAAAQLLEGATREGAGPATPANAPAIAGGVSAGMLAMERDIVATIAQYGGWNPQCLHRLALIAHSRGVSQEDFLGAIDSFRRVPAVAADAGGTTSGARRQGPLGRLAGESSSHVGTVEEKDPTPKVILSGLAAIVILLGLLGGAIYLVAALTSGGGKQGVVPSIGPGAGTEASGDVEPVKDESHGRVTPELFPSAKGGGTKSAEPASASASAGDVPALLKELREIIEVVAKDPAAAQARFVVAMRDARDLWTRASVDQIAGLQDSVVEYVYRAGRGVEGREAIAACVSGVRELPAAGIEAAQVRAAVYSAGLIARLSRERELPGESADVLAALMRESFFRTMSIGDASFKGGATSACVELATRMTPRAGKNPVEEAKVQECWKTWLECVEASGLEKPLRDRLVLQALDSLLRDSPEPTHSKPVFDGIGVLAAAFAWTAGEDARGRLLRWFDDPDVSAPDLHAVTLAVVDKGLVAGVDASMVLSAGAGEAARSELRDRYREAWGASGASTRALASKQFLEAAESALRLDATEGIEARLLSALWCSRLCEVAGAIWLGRAQPTIPLAPEIMPSAAVAAAMPGVSILLTPESVPSSSWAVRYLAERTRIPERLALLSAYTSGGDVERVLEAAVIVEEAVRGSPYTIRSAASQVVLAHASEAEFVNALLNESSTMPLTRDNASLVAQVSRGSTASLRSPEFRVVVRRSLVERLLELMSVGGNLGRVDAIADRLADSYQTRATWAADAAGRDAASLLSAVESGVATGDGASGTPGAIPPVERSARLLRLAMDDEARRHLPSGKEPQTLDGLRQDRLARTRAAQGRAQQFVVEQTGIVDLLAYLVVSESPSQRSAVVEVLDAYGTARRGAGHVAEQVEAGERAMLKLWMLRLQGEGA